MGEAKRKSKLKDRLIAECPLCIYCGGTNVADTVDHMPPIPMFDQRQRPKGLEFACCEACNRGGRLSEQVACLVGRMFPNSDSPATQAEVHRLMGEVHNNHPGLLKEMRHGQTYSSRDLNILWQAPKGSGLMRVDGPQVSAAVTTFCAKMAFALHYAYTGKAVPQSGASAVRWYTNYNLSSGEVPQDFIERLGPPSTLRQGSKTVDRQFLYVSAGTKDGTMSAFASFRVSFAMLAFVADDVQKLAQADSDDVTLPGFLLTKSFTPM